MLCVRSQPAAQALEHPRLGVCTATLPIVPRPCCCGARICSCSCDRIAAPGPLLKPAVAVSMHVSTRSCLPAETKFKVGGASARASTPQRPSPHPGSATCSPAWPVHRSRRRYCAALRPRCCAGGSAAVCCGGQQASESSPLSASPRNNKWPAVMPAQRARGHVCELLLSTVPKEE